MFQFEAELQIIGVNPYVLVPDEILQSIFDQAGKSKGFIPICGLVNETSYTQTLVKYRGFWRLYINMKMLKNSPKRIGEIISLTVQYDQQCRSIESPALFTKALKTNAKANEVFNNLSASRKYEIIRYLANLKTEDALLKNIKRAIDFLNGNGRFVGRNKP
jgi:hypothetical protein